MDFFQQQAQARRRSLWLLCGFVLGLVLVVFCVFELAQLLVRCLQFFGSRVNPHAPLWCALGVAVLICLGSAWGCLQTDGALLARAVGATALVQTTTDPSERQLVHVVQEMAIAASCAVPAIFSFEEESINAFAVGSRPECAVIAVSRGALRQLTRDELQAVVAHEFSHIFNGDMRLNMHMLGALTGLRFMGVVGQLLWRRRSAQSMALGAALVALGAVGALVAQITKAAVARQREYLADASAVQFTRNPAGLYGALRKVQRRQAIVQPALGAAPGAWDGALHGDRTPDAGPAQAPATVAFTQAFFTQLMSHFFFAPVVTSGWEDWIATHPAVQDRMEALDPQGRMAQESAQPSAFQGAQHAARNGYVGMHLADGAPIALPSQMPGAPDLEASSAPLREPSLAQVLRERIPSALQRQLESPAGAAALVQGMVLSVRPFVRQAQRDILAQQSNTLMAQAALRAQARMVDLPQVLRLPLLDMAMPALRAMDRQAQDEFLKTVNLLVLADGKLNAFELSALALLQRNLRPEETPQITATASQHMRLALSYIAYCGARGLVAAAAPAYAFALRQAPALRLREILALEECEPQAVRRSLLALAGLTPRDKQHFMAAVQACAMHDQVVHVSEWEIVRVVCQCLEVHCPLAPPGRDARVFVS